MAAICVCAGVAATAQRGDMLDRILAVVDGAIITLSDVRAALKFGLVPPDVSTDPVHAALTRLIDRRLMLGEVERYAPPEPAQATIDAGVAAIRARFKSPEAFEVALQQSALTADEIRRYVRDSLRIEAYLLQRFASTGQPTDNDIQQYYETHAADFTRDGVLQPLSEVRSDVRVRLLDERKTQAISDWLAALRRRGSIVELPVIAR